MNKITRIRLHDVWKIKFPEYSENTIPKGHVRAIQLAVSRAHLNDEGKEAGYCPFFAENLTGPALEWFTVLKKNSIDNFTQLISAFFKQYPVFTETTYLLNLKQTPFEPLKSYITRFKDIKA